MACKNCEERRKRLRDAIMHGKMAEAVGETVAGLREMIGLGAAPEEPALIGDASAELAEPVKTDAKGK